VASSPALVFFSEDPEVAALQAMIKGLRHFGARPEFTMRHFKVLAAVELCLKLAKRPATIADIESFSSLKREEFEQHVRDLVAHRYLHEVVKTFGDGTPAYKMGSMGGTMMRTMFKHLSKAKEPMIG
jgi:hypothetical protein